jgi:hypothetical protein
MASARYAKLIVFVARLTSSKDARLLPYLPAAESSRQSKHQNKI